MKKNKNFNLFLKMSNYLEYLQKIENLKSDESDEDYSVDLKEKSEEK